MSKKKRFFNVFLCQQFTMASMGLYNNPAKFTFKPKLMNTFYEMVRAQFSSTLKGINLSGGISMSKIYSPTLKKNLYQLDKRTAKFYQKL